MNKKVCNKECNGIIKEIKVRGLNFPSTISVEYQIDGKTYTLNENLVMKKDKTIKFGFIPIGYSTKSQIELNTGIEAKAGNTVRIKYEESNPENAYLVDNDSLLTRL